MSGGRSARGFGAAAALALVLASCGSPALSLVALRARAGPICSRAQRRLTAIPPPSGPGGARAFLAAGIAALGPEVAQLRRLRASGDAAAVYETAVRAEAAELAALRGAGRAIARGAQPIDAFRSLQQSLRPQREAADDAWQALELPACVSR